MYVLYVNIILSSIEKCFYSVPQIQSTKNIIPNEATLTSDFAQSRTFFVIMYAIQIHFFNNDGHLTDYTVIRNLEPESNRNQTGMST